MRTAFVIPLAMAVVALVLGFAMFPRGQELAFMQLKANQYDEALTHLEELRRKGDLSVSLVNPLISLYEGSGDIDSAIEILERYVLERPKDLEARRILGKMYKDAMRVGDYQRNLEAVHLLAPGEATLRELAHSYSFNGQYDQYIQTLEALVERFDGQPEEVIELARVLASRGQPERAADVLLRLQKRRGASLTYTSHVLLMNLLVDQGRTEEALEHIRSQMQDKVSSRQIVDLVWRFCNWGYPQIGLEILEPLAGDLGTEEPVRIALIELLVIAGQKQRARRELRAWREESISEANFPVFVNLALSSGSRELAFDELASREGSVIPAWLLPTVVAEAKNSGRQELVNRIIKTAENDLLTSSPLLAAKLSLANGDVSGAQVWLDQAAEQTSGHIPDQIEIARLYLQTGQRNRALSLFDAIRVSSNVPVDGLDGLAELYLEFGRAEEGYGLFDSLRRKRPGSTLLEGWARLAVETGRPDDVVSWLAERETVSPELLQALYDGAKAGKQAELTLRCAEKLYTLQPSRDHRFRLADALLSAARPDEALSHIRVLLEEDDGDAEVLYVRALRATEANDETVEYYLRKLRDGGLSFQEENEILYALIELEKQHSVLSKLRQRAQSVGGGWLFAYAEAVTAPDDEAELITFLSSQLQRTDIDDTELANTFFLLNERAPDEALSVLADLAHSNPEVWSGTYINALTRAGEPQKLQEYILHWAENPNCPTEERRQLAFQLLEMGKNRHAEQIFMTLADNGGPDSSDLRQLLFLWGPRPERHALEWLTEHARDAAPGDRVAWMKHILSCGGDDRIVALVGGMETPVDSQVMPVYIEALHLQRQREELSRQIPVAARGTRDAALLRRYAYIAQVHGLEREVETVSRSLITIVPNDRDGLLQLGSIALRKRRFTEAEKLLKHALDYFQNDCELNFAYAEVLAELGESEKATVHYERVVDSGCDREKATMVIEASALVRLGRIDEARDVFEKLLKIRPDDKGARADYAALLLAIGSNKRAQEVLEMN